MSETKTILVVRDGEAVDALLVLASASLEAQGARVAWPQGGDDEPAGSLDAPEGSVFRDQPGATIGWTMQGGTLVAPPPPPEPTPAPGSRYTYKSDVVRRATDQEVDVLTDALDAAPKRLRLLWPSILRIEHDAPEFGALRDAMIAAVGETRADVLLAPST